MLANETDKKIASNQYCARSKGQILLFYCNLTESLKGDFGRTPRISWQHA